MLQIPTINICLGYFHSTCTYRTLLKCLMVILRLSTSLKITLSKVAIPYYIKISSAVLPTYDFIISLVHIHHTFSGKMSCLLLVYFYFLQTYLGHPVPLVTTSSMAKFSPFTIQVDPMPFHRVVTSWRLCKRATTGSNVYGTKWVFLRLLWTYKNNDNYCHSIINNQHNPNNCS